MHYSEKVLPILHCLGTDSYLVVKKQMSMENMLVYLGERQGPWFGQGEKGEDEVGRDGMGWGLETDGDPEWREGDGERVGNRGWYGIHARRHHLS